MESDRALVSPVLLIQNVDCGGRVSAVFVLCEDIADRLHCAVPPRLIEWRAVVPNLQGG